MTVYAIIEFGYCRNTRVYGVYSTREQAEKIADELDNEQNRRYDIYYRVQETTFNED